MKYLRITCVFIGVFLTLSIDIFAASEKPKFDIERIDPPNWWAGMKHNTVELLIYGKNLAGIEVSSRERGVSVGSVRQTESDSYVMVKLTIDENYLGGVVPLLFKSGRKKKTVEYPILARKARRAEPLDASDFIYLIMPDRFANGDVSNDKIAGAHDQTLNRNEMFHRHGGDLQGVENHLDYLKDLGTTAIWLNPTIENDEDHESYHGYALTDCYASDARICTNTQYQNFVNTCHDKDMKVIRDVVLNHWGDKHALYQNPPFADWFHNFEEYTRTNFRATLLIDQYASENEKQTYTDGWFDHHMPDLNQKSGSLATYLIQNHIWWIEFADIDAFRIDTYAYPDQAFMADWAKEIKLEYPNFFFFAETWVHGSTIQSYFMENNAVNPGLNTHIDGLTDFQLYYALNNGFNENWGWTEGVSRFYYTLVKDVLVDNPMNNVTFLDNHDLSRYYSMVEEDFDKWKMGVGLMMTTRGIPSLYYGTEILMKNFSNPDGKVREDFPGGWIGDKENKFEASGRTEKENAAHTYIKTIANWRKTSKAITEGKLMQFIPKGDIYVYFRYTDSETVMVALNASGTEKTIEKSSYSERIGNTETATDVVSGLQVSLGERITIPANSILILEF